MLGPSLPPRGGTQIFFRIRRLGPSIYRSPQKNIRNFKHPKKNFEILATQKISQFCTLTLKKDPKLHRNDPQTSPILWWPQKISTKSSYPKKILIFLKTRKNIEIQNLEPPKMGRAYVCVKISEYPPPPTPPGVYRTYEEKTRVSLWGVTLLECHPPPPPSSGAAHRLDMDR